jgi:glutathione-regulated potassium-efflux system ancillary protein KefF
MILIIYAHPYPQHSHANKRMLEQAGTLDGVEIRSSINFTPISISISLPSRRRWPVPIAHLAASDAVVQRAAAAKLWMDKVLAHRRRYGASLCPAHVAGG